MLRVRHEQTTCGENLASHCPDHGGPSRNSGFCVTRDGIADGPCLKRLAGTSRGDGCGSLSILPNTTEARIINSLGAVIPHGGKKPNTRAYRGMGQQIIGNAAEFVAASPERFRLGSIRGLRATPRWPGASMCAFEEQPVSWRSGGDRWQREANDQAGEDHDGIRRAERRPSRTEVAEAAETWLRAELARSRWRAPNHDHSTHLDFVFPVNEGRAFKQGPAMHFQSRRTREQSIELRDCSRAGG
ncbi:hypothetical protein B0J12DRAFT_425615 [Macrophomina phaseolina]|uniref:Uncharacterized protein n=1 Tax=Macrophomina phaseolina TaxID=35725 RepID=A0ABQ8GJB5_9PEZI|nr:hypothetical protein B0J12DRAFT_425615 [Macrophomina phaseolina]